MAWRSTDEVFEANVDESLTGCEPEDLKNSINTEWFNQSKLQHNFHKRQHLNNN